MKIFLLPVEPRFQPARQPFRYPRYNADYGVEQDFLAYLKSRPDLRASSARGADWHYLPIFWTRFHLNRNHRPEGLAELQTEVGRAIEDDQRTFTVCQFDDGPIANLGKTLQCLSSRKSPSIPAIDIPLLASPIPSLAVRRVSRKYLASFLGQFKNHPIRRDLHEFLKDRPEICFRDGDFGLEALIETTLESRIGICPRGYGGSSFRLFEVMQLHRVPLVVGDVDPRPFKRFIAWEGFSFYVEEAKEAVSLLDRVPVGHLSRMGRSARAAWELLRYGKWCPYVLLEIEWHRRSICA